MDINEICLGIRGLTERNDLEKLIKAVKEQQGYIASLEGSKFKSGDNVKWKSRRGMYVNGTILRVNQKSVSVKAEDGVSWRVSPSLLEKV